MPRPPSSPTDGPLLLLTLLLLAIAAGAFHPPLPPPPPHHPPPLQAQHSRWRRRQQQRVALAAAAAAGAEGADGDSSSGSNTGSGSKDDADGGGGGPIKPRAFVTKRMRRGPLGPNSSSSANKSPPSPAAAASDATAAAGTGTSTGTGTGVLKLSKTWACVAGCGACCYLQPEERPYLMDYFEDPEDLALYNSMVGDDGWCVHYDKAARACTVFQDRPWFCRVEAETFNKMYEVEPAEMDKFCTGCCREQIGDVYGAGSPEMLTFNTAIKALKAAARAEGAAGGKGGGGKGFGGGGGGGKKGEQQVVPIDPFTKEAVGPERVKADWV